KGVMVEHRNVVNVVGSFARAYTLKSGINVPVMSELTFDASVDQLFGTILHGATLHIVPKEILLEVEELRKFIRKKRIDIINFVPSLLNELLSFDGRLESVQRVISGAEKLEESVKNRILQKGYRLYNHYGPTETTVEAITTRCTEAPVTLGTPVENVRCYVLDKNRNLLPVGVPGELYIAGAGVARGYLNRPELTADKFIKYKEMEKNGSSWLEAKEKGTVFYASGDQVRRKPTGEVEYIGRLDEQVKIRGFRVELGEIESRLLTHPGIKEAVVITQQSEDGESILCAYYEREIKSVEEEELRKYLTQTLPQYMLPTYFIPLEKLPLTTNGKSDRKALAGKPLPGHKAREKYRAPRDTVEEKLVEIWAGIVTVAKGQISIDDNFFSLGGHSLKAARMAARIHKEMDVKVPLAEIFKTPTPAGIAAYIKQAARDKYEAIPPVEKKEYYGLSSAQKRIYILQKMEQGNRGYNMPALYKLEGKLHKQRLEKTFRQLITRHESLRTTFHIIEETPVQKIQPTVEFAVESYEGERKGLGKPHPVWPEGTGFFRTFDLEEAPLLRVGVIENAEGIQHLGVEMHHIIS
ncbi:MAG: AMP-binding protein, partial [bacterium]|nr:AMP-binding protein [bacterium]